MASIVVGRTCIQATLYVIGRVDVKRRGCCVIVRWQAVFVVGGRVFSFKQLLEGLGEWTSRGRDVVLQWGDVLCCRMWESSDLNDSLWDWE